MSRFSRIIGLGIALAVCQSPVYADISVSSWGLGIEVDDFDTSTYVGNGTGTVVNPLLAAYQVSLPGNPATNAAAQYDISWFANYGSFNTSAQLAAQDGHSIRSYTPNTIYIQSDADLILSLDSVLNYELPTYGLYADLSFEVWDITTSQTVFGQGVWYGTVLDPPGSGSLGIAADIFLPANHQFRVQYSADVETFGASNGLATAEGYVNFELAPTPEPASLALLLAAAPMIRCRRRA